MVRFCQLLHELQNKTKMSPLLFNIVLEVQAREFVRVKKTKFIQMRKEKVKCLLADDSVYVANPK